MNKKKKDYNFCYNFSFLNDWLKMNPEFKRTVVCDQTGITFYRTFQGWVKGKTMMPLQQMLHFCNTFNVPITAFFLKEDAGSESMFAPITDERQIEPTNGWNQGSSKSNTPSRDPRTDVHFDSVLPDYCKHDGWWYDSLLGIDESIYVSADNATNSCDDAMGISGLTEDAVLSPAQIISSRKMKALSIHQERMKSLDIIQRQSDIISRLQAQVIDLQNKVIELQNKRTQDVLNGIGGGDVRLYSVDNATYQVSEEPIAFEDQKLETDGHDE